MATGDTAYWHPFAWEAAGTYLYYEYLVTERYTQGREFQNFNFKTAHTSSELTYLLQARKYSSSLSATIQDVTYKITSMGVI